MKTCNVCSHRTLALLSRCRFCGEPFTPAPERTEDMSLPKRAIGIAAEFAIAGGLLMASGPFMPFSEAGEYASSGLGKTGVPVLAVLSCGAIVAVFGVMSVFLRRRYIECYLPAAAAAAITTLYYHLMVADQEATGVSSAGALGLGIYFCYLGAAFSLIAGAVCLVRTPSAYTRVRVAGITQALGETAVRLRPRLFVRRPPARRSAPTSRRKR